jgi:hypothetical protein
MKFFLFFAMIAAAAVSTSSLASPLYPWNEYHCSSVNQNDGRQIGAICGSYDSRMGVDVLDVYYFGYLANRTDFKSVYANLSIGNVAFHQRGMALEHFGDDHNLPKRDVFHAVFIATNSFQQSSEYPVGKDFAIYFQAEEVKPTHNPPFSFDNLFGNNYHGVIGHVRY